MTALTAITQRKTATGDYQFIITREDSKSIEESRAWWSEGKGVVIQTGPEVCRMSLSSLRALVHAIEEIQEGGSK